MTKLNLLIIFIISFSSLFAQTKSYGNYEVYTYEPNRSGISYLSMDVNFPDYLNSITFEQIGILYSHQYFIGEMGTYNFSNNARLRFITEGNFNIGFGYSNTRIKNQIPNSIYSGELKLYTGKIDFYSFNIGTEFTYVLKDGVALTAKFAMNIFSIGASFGLPDGGKIKDDLFGVANILPLAFYPQILVDFGRSVFGVGLIIHPKNFIEYKYVPPGLFTDDEKGLKFNDNFMSDLSIQLLFSY